MSALVRGSHTPRNVFLNLSHFWGATIVHSLDVANSLYALDFIFWCALLFIPWYVEKWFHAFCIVLVLKWVSDILLLNVYWFIQSYIFMPFVDRLQIIHNAWLSIRRNLLPIFCPRVFILNYFLLSSARKVLVFFKSIINITIEYQFLKIILEYTTLTFFQPNSKQNSNVLYA